MKRYLIGTAGTAQFEFSTMSFLDYAELTETVSGSNVFTNGNLFVRQLQISGQPRLAISDGMALTNAIFTVWETAPQSNVFRNYNEPIPTNLSPEDIAVPSFVPWRLKITGLPDAFLISQVCVTTTVDNVAVTFSPTRGGVLWSDQKFVLIPDGNLIPLPSQDYVPLRIDPAESKWWDEAHKDVTASLTLDAGNNIEVEMQKLVKSLLGALVLQSLRWVHSSLEGLDPETRIAKPLREMGYSITRDYSASRSKVLSDYVQGHIIWYSMSHGGTKGGKPWHPFQGLLFKDGWFFNGVIRASDLSPLNLNYKLVVADGCCSAQTSLASKEDAKNETELLDHAKDFANAFGTERTAYMGWSWEMGANSAQIWSSQFINNLKFDTTFGRGLKVEEAHQKFLDSYAPASGQPHTKPATKYMKIHGKTESIIDLRTWE